MKANKIYFGEFSHDNGLIAEYWYHVMCLFKAIYCLINKNSIMKSSPEIKIFLYAVSFSLSVTLNLSASPITYASAKLKAERIFSYSRVQGRKHLVKSNKQKHAICISKGYVTENDNATYYIFNRKESPGFAIIAGDDSMPAVIGYSLENSVDIDNMPEALKKMLSDYDQYVYSLRGKGNTLTANNLGPIEPGTIVVEPYIKTKWNQREPYNWLTPQDSDGQKTPTGCVITAVAQILNYYKWPDYLYHKYNWELMKDSYDEGYTEEEGMAVATLMRDLGCILGASYTNKGTWASPSSVSIRGYSVTSCEGISFASDKEKLYEAINKAPIMVEPGNNMLDGPELNHLIIIDGYDSNKYVHINWGWGGHWDGFYDMDNIYIKNGSRDWKGGIATIYYVLKPVQEEDMFPIPVASEGISYDKTTINAGDVLRVTLHNVKSVSGNSSVYPRYINLLCYSLKYENDFEYPNLLYNHGGIIARCNNALWLGNNTEQLPTIKEGDDYTFVWETPNLPKNGQYVLMPFYYGNQQSDWGGFNDWSPFPHVWNRTRDEFVPFEYQDGRYIFKDLSDVNNSISPISYNGQKPIYYTIDGIRRSTPPHGFYIEKYSNGITNKKYRK